MPEADKKTHADLMRDHWWWRPGWQVGRRFYTWHITFESAADVHRIVGQYQERLDGPGIDIIPPRWLHLTMQGIGFVHETKEADVQRIVEIAQERCAQLMPFDLTLGPAVVDPEAIMLRLMPVDPVRGLRHAIRAAIADVWGPDNVPEAAKPFNPHVSIAYSNAVGPAAPYIAGVDEINPEPARTTVAEAQLIVLDRDERVYRWDTYGTAPLANRG